MTASTIEHALAIPFVTEHDQATVIQFHAAEPIQRRRAQD
jgi:hypothetical protein